MYTACAIFVEQMICLKVQKYSLTMVRKGWYDILNSWQVTIYQRYVYIYIYVWNNQ